MSPSTSTTVKLTVATRDRVNALGEATGQTAEQVVATALDEYERALFFQEYRDAVLARSAAEKGAYDAEFAEWDQTVRDGLGDA
ncbi:MAG: hypothetical protein ACT4QG_03770 [Sporichthyaceae bacterium]